VTTAGVASASRDEKERLLEDFVDAVHSHHDPICTGQEARKSVALVCAIYDAAKSGNWVTPA